MHSDWDMVAIAGGAGSPSGNYALYYSSLVFPCITPLTIALPVLAYLRQRKSPGRSFLLPGLGGCVAASGALALRGFENLPFFLRNLNWQIGPIQPWVLCGEKVGYAVIGAWAMLAVAGRWRIGPGWLERVGVLVGLIWAVGAIGFVVLRVHWGELFRSLLGN